MTCLVSCPLGKWECKVTCPEGKSPCPEQWDGTFFEPWEGPKEILIEFLSCLYSKNDRIKLMYYVIDESGISFLDLFLYKDANLALCSFLPIKSH